MKKVGITGAAGNVGSTLTEGLQRQFDLTETKEKLGFFPQDDAEDYF